VTSEFQTVQLAVTDSNGKFFVTWWTPSAGWEKDHTWTPIPAFADGAGRFWLASRMDGQIELYVNTRPTANFIGTGGRKASPAVRPFPAPQTARGN
jgi:hypothetical protein